MGWGNVVVCRNFFFAAGAQVLLFMKKIRQKKKRRVCDKLLALGAKKKKFCIGFISGEVGVRVPGGEKLQWARAEVLITIREERKRGHGLNSI